MLHIAVCEDDPIQSEIIRVLLDKYQDVRPGINLQSYSFDSGNKVLQSIDSGQEFDLFLLDILLPEMNGIELARKLRVGHIDIPLVFLTSSADYALDAFKVSAFQYILKPVKRDDIFPVLDSITALLKHEKERFFMLAMRKNTIKIPHRSIVCAELEGRVLKFYLDNGDILLSRTIRMSFADAIASLLEDKQFLYEHKSFALNMEHVKEVGNDSFKMKGGIEVRIPKYNFARAKARYFAWVNEQN